MGPELLASTVRLFEELEAPEMEAGGFSGRLRFRPEVLPLLRILDDRDLVRSIAIGHRHFSVQELATADPVGEDVLLGIDVVYDSKAPFARDMTDLLSHPTSRFEEPEVFYLAASRFSYPRDSSPESVAYLDALELTRIVTAVADHKEIKGGVRWLVCLTDKTKIEIPIEYGVQDLAPLEGLSQLVSTALTEPNENEKRSILKGAVVETVLHTRTADRFRTLLHQFPELKQRFDHNLELYIKNFSFETEVEKIAGAAREYLIRLNAAVADIHVKLLAVPTAVVLVAGQMKPLVTIHDWIVNLVLLAAAVFFTVIMIFLTVNQRQSLEAVRLEYTARRSRLRAEMPGFEQTLAKSFDTLDERYQHQRKVIRWLHVVVWVALGLCVAAFCWHLINLAGPVRVQRILLVPMVGTGL